MKKFGWKKDPVDIRDSLKRSSRKGSDLPSKCILIPPKVTDQGMTSSCVGCAVTKAIETQPAPYPKQSLSELFTYFLARREQGWEKEDEGAYIRDALKTGQQIGMARSETWPLVADAVNSMPAWKAWKEAAVFHHDINYIYQRVLDQDSMKEALNACNPVVVGMMVGQQLLDYQGGILSSDPPPYLGGHAMFVYGYDGDAWHVQNSWGKTWGVSGRARIAHHMFDRFEDAWAIRRLTA